LHEESVSSVVILLNHFNCRFNENNPKSWKTSLFSSLWWKSSNVFFTGVQICIPI